MKLQYQISLYLALMKKGYYSITTFKEAKKQIEENIKSNNLEDTDEIKLLINESVSSYKKNIKCILHSSFFFLIFFILL